MSNTTSVVVAKLRYVITWELYHNRSLYYTGYIAAVGPLRYIWEKRVPYKTYICNETQLVEMYIYIHEEEKIAFISN